MDAQRLTDKMDKVFQERRVRSEEILRRIDEASASNNLKDLSEALLDLVKNTKPITMGGVS